LARSYLRLRCKHLTVIPHQYKVRQAGCRSLPSGGPNLGKLSCALVLVWPPSSSPDRSPLINQKSSSMDIAELGPHHPPPPLQPLPYIGSPSFGRPRMCHKEWGTRSMSGILNKVGFLIDLVRIWLSSCGLHDIIVYIKWSSGLHSMTRSLSKRQWWWERRFSFSRYGSSDMDSLDQYWIFLMVAARSIVLAIFVQLLRHSYSRLASDIDKAVWLLFPAKLVLILLSMTIDCFNIYVCSRSLSIASQIKILGECTLVFTGLWSDFLLLP
jgi:hypothetical protein